MLLWAGIFNTISPPEAAPVLTDVQYTDNNDGSFADLVLSYTGNVTGFRVYLATGDATLSVTAAQLYAGSGGTGTIEFDSADLGTDVDLTGFTSASTGAVRIAAALIKSADGSSPSNVVTEVVSGLDFTVPTFSSGNPADGATDVSVSTSPALTFDNSIYGVASGEVYLRIVAGALVETFTFSSASAGTGDNGGTLAISGAVLTVNPGANLSATSDYTIRWAAGAFVDQDGNPVAANTGDTIYNFTTAAATAWSFTESDGEVSIDTAPAAPSAPTVNSAGDGEVTLS